MPQALAALLMQAIWHRGIHITEDLCGFKAEVRGIGAHLIHAALKPKRHLPASNDVMLLSM